MSARRILILCTGNSCRSQMAEGFLRSFDGSLHVDSAGTHPAAAVHPLAVRVMREAGIDLAAHTPKSVSRFLTDEFDYVITVCGEANESCPRFTGTVRHRLHIGFDDPAKAAGSDEHLLAEFRRVRDEIRTAFAHFYHTLP